MATICNRCFWFAEDFKIFTYETTNPNNMLVGTNNLCGFIHRKSSFLMDTAKNVILIVKNWRNLKSPLKLQIHIIWNLQQMMFVRFSTHVPQFFLIQKKTWLQWYKKYYNILQGECYTFILIDRLKLLLLVRPLKQFKSVMETSRWRAVTKNRKLKRAGASINFI